MLRWDFLFSLRKMLEQFMISMNHSSAQNRLWAELLDLSPNPGVWWVENSSALSHPVQGCNFVWVNSKQLFTINHKQQTKYIIYPPLLLRSLSLSHFHSHPHTYKHTLHSSIAAEFSGWQGGVQGQSSSSWQSYIIVMICIITTCVRGPCQVKSDSTPIKHWRLACFSSLPLTSCLLR